MIDTENRETLFHQHSPKLSTSDVLSLDEAYQKIGGFGKFQIMATTLLVWSFCTGAFLVNNLALLELQPRYLCYGEHNETYECTADHFCGTDIEYFIDWDYYTSLHNWVEDLDLTCTSKAKIGLIGSVYFFGWTFAAIFIPRLSDIYGRKIVYFISMTGHLALYLAIIFSHNLDLTIALMFICGCFSCGRASVGYLYMQELTETQYQTTVGTILQILNSLIPVFGALYFEYISKYWLWLLVFGWFINLICVVGIFFLPESPKYLISKKRYEDARESLQFIAFVNHYKKPLTFKFEQEVNERRTTIVTSKQEQIQNNTSDTQGDQQAIFMLQELITRKSNIEEEKQLTGSLKDLIKIRRHLINLILIVCMWIASSFNYYLISFQMKYIKGNIYTNTIVSSLSEAPAQIIAGYSYHKIGIRFTLFVAFTIAIIGAIALIILESSEAYVPIMVFAAKFGVSATFNVCYLANAQLFPAIFAGTAFGLSNFFAKLSSSLAPLLAEVDNPTPMIIFVVTCGIAMVLSFFIKTEQSKANKV